MIPSHSTSSSLSDSCHLPPAAAPQPPTDNLEHLPTIPGDDGEPRPFITQAYPSNYFQFNTFQDSFLKLGDKNTWSYIFRYLISIKRHTVYHILLKEPPPPCCHTIANMSDILTAQKIARCFLILVEEEEQIFLSFSH